MQLLHNHLKGGEKGEDESRLKAVKTIRETEEERKANGHDEPLAGSGKSSRHGTRSQRRFDGAKHPSSNHKPSEQTTKSEAQDNAEKQHSPETARLQVNQLPDDDYAQTDDVVPPQVTLKTDAQKIGLAIADQSSHYLEFSRNALHQGLSKRKFEMEASSEASSRLDNSTKFAFTMRNHGSHYTLRVYVVKNFVKEVRQSLNMFPKLPKRSKLRIVGNNREVVKALRTRYRFQQVEVIN